VRSKRKRGIFEGLANVFMGSTAMAGGGAAIGLGLAITGLAALSVATFGIAAAAIGGAALLGAIGLGAYKYFSARSERKEAQAAAEQVGNLPQQIRDLNSEIFHAKEGDRGPLRAQKQGLEASLRNAELTLYRLNRDAAMRRLSDLMASDDDEISESARHFAEHLVGNDQDLLGDLRASPHSLELIKSQAYGV
jgi:TolA-binding protein